MSNEKSKCPKCGNETFEIKEEKVQPEERIHFVRCTKCFTIIGLVDRVIPFSNLNVLEGKLDEALRKLATLISR